MFNYIVERTSYIRWVDSDVSFVRDEHAYLDFHSESSMEKQSEDIYVAPPWHIILIPSQPVFALSS